MNRKSPKPQANPKQQSNSNAQPAGNGTDSAGRALVNQKPNRNSKPASFSEAAKQDRQRSPTNGSHEGAANGPKNSTGHAPSVGGRGGNSGKSSGHAAGGGSGANARSHSREAPVRLPSRNSVSPNTPAIQFGSFNEQTRTISPPPAQQQRAPAAAEGSVATSGGVPVSLGKPTSKPSFGSISTHNASKDDSTRRPSTSGSNTNASSGQQNHGRQQHHHHSQQRPASRASNQSRQSQGYGSGRKDSSNYKQSGQKAGPRSRDQGTDAPHNPQNEGAAAGYQGGQPQQASGPGTPVMHSAQPMVGVQQQQQQQQQQQMPQPPQQHQQQQPQMNSGHPQQPSHYAGSPYRGQNHQHMRPPHSQSPGIQYKHQSGAHYAPHHHMGAQPMSQPMGYPVPVPGQPPMQPPMMTSQPNMQPIQGWMQAPPPQFAYMPMAAPAYDQYYRPPPQGAGGPPPPHNMYGVPAYSMPTPTHAGSAQMGAGGIMAGPMASGAQMPGMTVAPMTGQPPHHGLSASAQTFVPGRRAVRIVNPTTNEEIDISQQQRLRSVSATSSTPRNAASGTASPASGPVADRRELAATPVEQAPEEEVIKPKFKIPSTRAIKIVNPNAVAKPSETAGSGSDEAKNAAAKKPVEVTAPAAGAETVVEKKPAPESKPIVAEEKTDSMPKQKDADKPAESVVVAEKKAEVPAPVPVAKETPPAAVLATEEKETPIAADEPKVAKAEPEPEPEPSKEADIVAAAEPELKTADTLSADELVSSLAKTTISDKQPVDVAAQPVAEKNEKPSAPAIATPVPEPENKTTEDSGKKEPEIKVTIPASTEPKAEEKKVEEEEEDEEAEDGEIDESDESTRTPTTLQSRSRQVTFSEPATPASAARKFEREEVVEFYSGKENKPTIVGDILRYPRAFLEQFNNRCEAPTMFHFEISNTDDRRSSDRSSGMRRSMSGSGRNREPMSSSREFGMMGSFRHTQSPTHGSALTSEERFRQSNEMRARSDMSRSSGMGGRPPSGQMRSLGSGRESRGGRNNARGRGRGRGRGGSQHGGDRPGAPGQGEMLANVKPLEKSENRYIAKSLQKGGKGGAEDDMDEEVYNRRMRSLLNKLTLDNFEPVSDELLEWGNKSTKETDGRIVRHLIMLIFDKATDEAVWAHMYARLCYKLICKISDSVIDSTLPHKEGNQLFGGFLVRKYLLSKCQEEFESGWKVVMPADMESAEYFEAAKTKRRGLGLVRFIGELYLLDILTSRIIQECIKRLLASYESPEEEETESLCKLLTTIGKKIDKPASKTLVDAYFARVKIMSENKKIISRIRFMLKDVLDLRQRNWVNANSKDAGPMTIAEVHEEIERKKAADAAQNRAPLYGRRSESHSGREGHGGRRGGWNTTGGPSGSGRNDQSQQTGDITGFGNLSRSKGTATMSSSGPGASPFSNLVGGSRGWSSGSANDNRRNRDDRHPIRTSRLGGGRTPSHSSRGGDSTLASPEPVRSSNMFDMLSNNDDEDSHVSPRANATKGASKVPPLASSAMASSRSSASPSAKPMDAEALKRRIKGMLSEYVDIKMETEFIECFKELTEVNYQPAVFAIVNNVMDMRPNQVPQVFPALSALRKDNLVSEDIATSGLAEFAELLEDIALDSPNAFGFFGQLMAVFNVPLTRVSEALGELATKLSTLSPPALAILKAYLKQLVEEIGEDETKDAIEAAKFDIAQYCNADKRSDADVKRYLDINDLLPLFPKYK